MLDVRPVIAAVPNYNHGEALGGLLPSILEQEYAGVVVCDDASKDGSLDILSSFLGDVEVIAGAENVGAGANRNRVLQSKTLERLGSTALIHFLDADSKLLSKQNPERVNEALQSPDIGIVGGLVLNEDGTQNFLNFGPSIAGPVRCINAYATGAVAGLIESQRGKNPERAARLRHRLDFVLREWPNTFESAQTQTVDWVIEANMAVAADTFTKIGFDPKLRFHEIQELARQYEALHLKVQFDPSISIVRRNIDVRGSKRHKEEVAAGLRLVTRYTFHRPRMPALPIV